MTFLAGDRRRLERFRAGERSALAEVYRHYYPQVARALRHGFQVRTKEGQVSVPGLCATADIENACQEIFLRAFRERARAAYDGKRAFLTWLLGIGRNWRIDQHRRRRPMISLGDVGALAAEATPDQQAVHSDLRRRVDRYVASLPARERRYYEARFRRSLSQAGAAAEQGLTRIQGRRLEWRIKEGLVAKLIAEPVAAEPMKEKR